MRYFTAPVPSMPIQQCGERAAPAQLEETSCQQQTSASAGFRGDYGVVSDGEHYSQEPYYDHVIQTTQEDTVEFDQGYFDDTTEQQEFNISEVGAEEELIFDVSVEASLCWDSDGDIYY